MKKTDVIKLFFLGFILASGNAISSPCEEYFDEYCDFREEYLSMTQEEQYLVRKYMKELSHSESNSQEVYIDIEKIEKYYQRDEATRTSM